VVRPIALPFEEVVYLPAIRRTLAVLQELNVAPALVRFELRFANRHQPRMVERRYCETATCRLDGLRVAEHEVELVSAQITE
jgi:hypothetical protein